MNFKEFFYLDNVNNRLINPSGQGGNTGTTPAGPQKGLASPNPPNKIKGGAFGGGNDLPKIKDISPSSFNPADKDSLFGGRPPSPFSPADTTPPNYKPAPGPHLPGILPKKNETDPTKVKQVAPPKMPQSLGT